MENVRLNGFDDTDPASDDELFFEDQCEVGGSWFW